MGCGACTAFSPLQIPSSPAPSDPWVTKMLIPLWLLSCSSVPFWGAVTPCPSCIGEGGPLELPAEGTGYLTRWAWGKGPLTGCPGELAKDGSPERAKRNDSIN